ncbi:mitochondrial branched-chain alpha-ketoacid dehydrogenase kinase-domain-containing protein [Pelagophyceae sp. CCMP2097]|nr:mitochondrial branched-chain alpha-ketoacid dehydrogenase kinase-domain-containing protein [Pelagophyceae sp. CCMP2097]
MLARRVVSANLRPRRVLCRAAPRRRFTDVVDDARIIELAKGRATSVSLRRLIEAGQSHLRKAPPDRPDYATTELLSVAAFLHRELQIRLALRVCELDRIPSLTEMPSVRKVREWYAQSIREIAASRCPVDEDTEAEFAKLLTAIYERHSAVLFTMARGAHELRLSMGNNERFVDDAAIHGFLDSFYTSRIGIRMLIGQYLALRQCRRRNGCVGLLNTNVKPADVARDAVEQATSLCERQFGDAPKVEIHGRLDLTFSYVPDHLYYIMLELLKNSMRATVEHALRSAGPGADVGDLKMPSIKVVVADGEDNEDVALKVSDEGGGIARSHMPRVWSYLFTTASHEVQQRGFDDANDLASDFGGAPLAGLGYGLPISRAYARYFGGDVSLMSMEGYGTDAFVYLSRLGDHDEPLP